MSLTEKRRQKVFVQDILHRNWFARALSEPRKWDTLHILGVRKNFKSTPLFDITYAIKIDDLLRDIIRASCL